MLVKTKSKEREKKREREKKKIDFGHGCEFNLPQVRFG
jgi:hypothetical protein